MTNVSCRSIILLVFALVFCASGLSPVVGQEVDLSTSCPVTKLRANSGALDSGEFIASFKLKPKKPSCRMLALAHS